ncbi:hypothetical protein A6A12_1856 [Vibrio anguillarum]|nr:hypothetical protein A6A12_1856 [Vibrio anguillarum]
MANALLIEVELFDAPNAMTFMVLPLCVRIWLKHSDRTN